MNNVFNTPFEISLRVLLTLEVATCDKWLTSDMIAASDFITVYCKDFGLSNENLHGDNNFKFSEFTLRRELIQKAVKTLVLDGLVKVATTKNGFSFAISHKGRDYCNKFENSYSLLYRQMAKKVQAFLKGKSEREAFIHINRLSISTLQRSEING